MQDQKGVDGGATRQRITKALAPFMGLIIVAIIFYLIPPHQLPNAEALQTVAVHTVIVGIAAMGMTFIIISGGIDLSVGSGIALASVVVAIALKWWGMSLAVAIPLALLTGAACGLYNGILVTVLRLPPFIATLGTLGFFRGVTKWISNSQPVTPDNVFGIDMWVKPTPTPAWLQIAPAAWLTLILGVIMWAVLKFTVLGRYTYAIGSNESTARLCGIQVPRTKIYIYVLSGLLTGLAGLFMFARLTQGDPTSAFGWELDVIAAVVIGGASLSGGQGSIIGSLVGAFLMAYLRNRCVYQGWSNFVQEMIIGHVIIIAVAADQWRQRRMFR
jgi:ribose transport system permease protein